LRGGNESDVRGAKSIGADSNKRFNNHNYERARGEISLANRQFSGGREVPKRTNGDEKCREDKEDDETRWERKG